MAKFVVYLFALVVVCCLSFGCGMISVDDGMAPEPPAPPAPVQPEPSPNEVVPIEEAKDVVVEPTFWLSDEGVLHNSLCRWYEKCSGAQWDGTAEHKNCETCGGDSPIVRRWNLPKEK